MTEVGVREFKSDVSGYLKRAAAGERVRVTSRGRPMVELVPVPLDSDTPTISEMERLRASGIVTPARSHERVLPIGPYKANGSLSDDVIAERVRERGH